THFHLFAAVDDPAGDALRGAAVVGGDDHVLRDVGEFAGEVTAVRRFEGRIGETLAGAGRRAEVFEHRQPFAEVRFGSGFDDFAVRLGHQTAHSRELANLFDTAAGAGVRHQEDRVDIGAAVARVVLELLHHRAGDRFAGVRPRFEHLVVPLLVGDDAAFE